MENGCKMKFWCLFLFVSLSRCHQCPGTMIPFQDIVDSFQTSKAVYDEKLNIHSPIPYSSGYAISFISVAESELDEPCRDGLLKVVLAEKAFTTIIAFKGPNGPTKLKTDLLHYLEYFNGTGVDFAGNHTSVNYCFWKTFELLLPMVQDKLQDQARKYIITGHSTGGALASILALYMKVQEGHMWENSGTSLITFGQPRVGDERYAKLHDAMIHPFRKLRLVNDKDPVPHVSVWKQAVHHSREIWMTYDIMSKKKYWKICGDMDPLKCSNMWVLYTKMKDHSIKSYEDFVTNPPQVFLDKMGTTRFRKWMDAIEFQCEQNYKIEKIENKDILDNLFVGKEY